MFEQVALDPHRHVLLVSPTIPTTEICWGISERLLGSWSLLISDRLPVMPFTGDLRSVVRSLQGFRIFLHDDGGGSS